MTPEEQLTLIDALMDGEIDEADFIRLEAEMIVDEQVRMAYYRRLQLDVLLEQVASDPAEEINVSAAKTSGREDRSRRLFIGLMMAIAASTLVMLIRPWERANTASIDSQGGSAIAEISASGFGVLSGQSGAKWDGPEISNGELLPVGDLHLESGTVHVELFSGVQMVIQGESLFSIDSPMQVTMKKGRARARVPEPAQGFRIKTSTGDVVDLGTEFSIAVEDDESQINVIEGEVELLPSKAASRRLRDGEGIRLTSDGDVDEGSRESIDLAGPDEFQSRLAKRQSDQIKTWNESIETLRSDPRLVALYVPGRDDVTSRTLVNLATSEQNSTEQTSGSDSVAGGSASNGAVVAARSSDDRWGRSGGALDFSPMGSRIRVSVAGEHRGLTLFCWVKINSLDRWYNSLFLTDGHEEREPHWQIMNDGRVFFSVKPENVDSIPVDQRDRQIFYSPPFWNPSMSGQWTMLCTVYDVDVKRVTHYVNGEPISSTPIPPEFLVESIKIGSASICNWSEPMYRSDAEFVVRNLNGSVDEFAIFSGALSSQEIIRHYQSGNPNDH